MTEAAFFPGFQSRRFAVDGLSLHAVVGGSGPPLLLLHGAPQSHLMWRLIAPALAERFTVVIPDLRGYGLSDKPEAGDYSKRRMAADAVEIMGQLGFERFKVAGHDRGARVTRRLAKDHPGRVERAAILDIVPTAHVYANVTDERAKAFWHWFFFIQPAPMPELLMGPQAAVFAGGAARRLGASEAVVAAFVESNGTPEAFHAMCEDYRAGAGADLEHDSADAGVAIACPVLVMWGERSGTTGLNFDVPSAWAPEASDLGFQALDCGHFLPEEAPDQTLGALLRFFGE